MYHHHTLLVCLVLDAVHRFYTERRVMNREESPGELHIKLKHCLTNILSVDCLVHVQHLLCSNSKIGFHYLMQHATKSILVKFIHKNVTFIKSKCF
jgi:hypothetical protein